MGDNRSEPLETLRAPPTIAGYDAQCRAFTVGPDRLLLCSVAELERYVDRAALLRAGDPPEPPYWAHCWSGARVLADRVPHGRGRVLEVGCGLGLPGVMAARRGWQVVFADRIPTPLAFVRETLRANDLAAAGLVVADMLAAPWRAGFDLVLAAEVIYDRTAFAPLAAALAGALAPQGRILLADAHRIDTAGFYDAASAAGLTWTRENLQVDEEGFPVTVSIVTMHR